MDFLQFFILITLLFIGYRIQKLHEMLIDWKMEWDELNRIDEDEIDL